jgi:hypothetical protein
MRSYFLVLAAAAVGALAIPAVLVGCGGGDDESTAQTLDERVATVADAPMPTDGTLPTDGPYVGAWGANLTTEDLGAAAADTRYAGEFRLDLREDGTYTLFNDFDGETTGTYGAASDDFLVFTDDTGCAENFAGSGVYQWAVDGDQLTLTLVRPETGGCTGRSDTLTIPRWTRVED